MAKPTLNAIVAQKIETAPGLFILRVIPDGWELETFLPGQFAVLGLPRKALRHPTSQPEEKILDAEKFIQRAYSIGSAPEENGYLEFYITTVDGGALTPHLYNLKRGDRLWLSPKISGKFTCETVADNQHMVMIATGTGLAPYISMLRAFLPRSQKRRYALLHGVRQACDLTYQSELESMARLSPALSYLPIISRPHEDPIPWHGPTGHVQKLWQAGAIATAWGFKPLPENTHVFLCGSPGMIDGMTTMLKNEGFTEHTPQTPGNIHFEKYW